MNLQNIPLTGTKCVSVHVYSSSPSKKQNRDEKYLHAYADKDPMFAIFRRETTNTSSLASMQVEQLTNVALELGCTRKQSPDINEETH